MRIAGIFASVGLRARLATVALVAIAPFVGVIAGLEYDRREADKRDYLGSGPINFLAEPAAS